jgi:type I restriction enzyme S subunit
MKTETLSELKGTAQKNIVSVDTLKSLPFPLPPLTEQKRIVAKVDQLMTLCDQLETQQKQKAQTRVALNNAALDKLLTAQDPDEFNHHWQRVADNFHYLYDNLENLTKLRAAILGIAIQGKLVLQDRYDNSKVLLSHFRALKEELISGKEAKAPREMKDIKDSDLPFSIPSLWKWVRFYETVLSMNNGLYKPAKFYSDRGLISLRMYNIGNGKINFNDVRRVKVTAQELERYSLREGDLLVNRVNSKELVGKAAVIPYRKEPLVYESMNMRVRLLEDKILPKYINLVFRSEYIKDAFLVLAKEAISQASINQAQLGNLLMPLPPLEEQKRIVAKVDRLMALCDELEAKIKQSDFTAEKLTEATVQHMTAA